MKITAKIGCFAMFGFFFTALSPGEIVRQNLSPNSGLAAYWAGNGNARDSVGGHNGLFLGDAVYSRGVLGRAFKFDGNESFVKIPRSPDLEGGSRLTIEFWMKAAPRNMLDSYQGLVASDFCGVEISNGFQTTMGVNFYVTADNGQTWGITSEANGGGAQISSGEWHHIAGVYDGAQVRLYIDGMAWGNPAAYSGMISDMTDDGFFALGSEDGRANFPNCLGNRYFNGAIDEVRIFHRALSASDVHNIYRHEKPAHLGLSF